MSRLKFSRGVDMIRRVASEFTSSAGWDVVGDTFPVFEVVWTHPRSSRRVGFRFSFDDWNEQAPSLELFDPIEKTPLPWDKWPQGGWAVGNPHPTTGKPFLCLPGIREYHNHASHLNDLWTPLQLVDSYAMPHLLHRVQQRFEDSNG